VNGYAARDGGRKGLMIWMDGGRGRGGEEDMSIDENDYHTISTRSSDSLHVDSIIIMTHCMLILLLS
jgi:hypothetical protein